MDETAFQFRESRIRILEFIASESRQVEFASSTNYGNYAEEFSEWWFEDWHPESPLFKSAFQNSEIDQLRNFSSTWDALEPEFCNNMPINELVSNSAWRQVMASAMQILTVVHSAT